MTRVNVGIEPKSLPGKLLLSEHREITRIPNAIKSRRAKLVGIPAVFVLGTGHVRFFYDKLEYLAKRYDSLLAECKARGFNVTDKSEAFKGLPEGLMNDYRPSESDIKLITARIEGKGFKLV